MVKEVKNSSRNTKLVFWSAILRKDKKDISKKVGETNQRLKTIVNKKVLILLTIVILQKNTSEVKSYILIKEVTLF